MRIAVQVRRRRFVHCLPSVVQHLTQRTGTYRVDAHHHGQVVLVQLAPRSARPTVVCGRRDVEERADMAPDLSVEGWHRGVQMVNGDYSECRLDKGVGRAEMWARAWARTDDACCLYAAVLSAWLHLGVYRFYLLHTQCAMRCLASHVVAREWVILLVCLRRFTNP